MKFKIKCIGSISGLLAISFCVGCQPEFWLGERIVAAGPMGSYTGIVINVSRGIDLGDNADPEQVYYKIQSGAMTNEYRKIGDVRVNMRTMNQVWMASSKLRKIDAGNANPKAGAMVVAIGECVVIESPIGVETGKAVDVETGLKLNHHLDPKGIYYKIQIGADANDTDGYWIDARLLKRTQ
jgi:hypothetical protein